ncbi:MAG TPA: hypothetical protein V6D50_00310 [Chroococcales cyanobacterium]
MSLGLLAPNFRQSAIASLALSQVAIALCLWMCRCINPLFSEYNDEYNDSRLSGVQLTSDLYLKTISPVPHPNANCYRRQALPFS